MGNIEILKQTSNEAVRGGLNVDYVAWRVMNTKNARKSMEVRKLYNMRARQRPETKH